jgi:hypothetical protein
MSIESTIKLPVDSTIDAAFEFAQHSTLCTAPEKTLLTAYQSAYQTAHLFTIFATFA